MVRVFPVERFDVQVAPGVFGEGVPEVFDHFDGKVSHPVPFEIGAVIQVESSRQIDDGPGQRLVHRYVGVSETANKSLVAQRFPKSVPQRNGHIFDGMVFVHMQIALAKDVQPEPSVLGEQVQHVVQKPDAGFVAICFRLIELERDADIGFRRFSRDGGAARIEFAGRGRGGGHEKGGPKMNIGISSAYCMPYPENCSLAKRFSFRFLVMTPVTAMDMATDGFASRLFRERAPAWAWLAAFVVFAATLPAQAQTPSSATYDVTFRGNWAVAPNGGLAAGVSVVSGAHFTRLIGAVHNSQVTFWESGGTATAGVEGVAELGATSTFSAEVRAAGSNAVLVSQSPGGGGTPTKTFAVDFTADRPLFTILSMIGPSPDWFVGVSGLSVLDAQNQWIDRHEIELFAYDAGTENGENFQLGNPATSPQGTITSLRGVGKFSDQPMGYLILLRRGAGEVNAAPAFTGSTNFSVQENSVTVGSALATDSDAADSVTGYAIESGSDGALFSITSAGALTFKAAPNYEDPQDADKDNVYSVKVSATSGTGDRELSVTETISVTVTDEDGEAPSAPEAPGLTAVSTFMLRAAWGAPANAGPDIDDYDYRYRELESASDWTEVTNTTITGLSVTIGGLSPGTTYEAQVLAKNAEGASDWSASGTGSTQAMSLGQVTGVSVTPQPGQLLVSWNAVAGATGYNVQWKAPGEDYDESVRQDEVGAVTEHTISNLVSGVEYTVRVMARGDDMAQGPPSEEAVNAPLVLLTTAFASDLSNASESAGVVNVAVRIDPAAPADITLTYALSGTATYGVDYTISGATGNSGFLVVPSGATEASIPVTIANDDVTEEDETVVLTLTNAAADTHVLTITDDDMPAFVVFFASDSARVGEAAGAVDVMANLSPAPSSDVVVSYALSGTATLNADYAISGATGSEGTLSVASGSNSAMISVTITDDDADEGDESVILTFQEGAGYGLGNPRVYSLTIVDNDQEPTSAEPAGREIPAAFALQQNYPNPFNPETTIRYGLPRAGEVRLAVYNALGHEVAVLVDRLQPAGHYAIRFEAGHLPSGLYAYRLQAGGEAMARTMLLVK